MIFPFSILCLLWYKYEFDLQLNQAIGSIEAIAKASKEHIVENTDLSTEKAETITRFFRDPKYYLGIKLK